MFIASYRNTEAGARHRINPRELERQAELSRQRKARLAAAVAEAQAAAKLEAEHHEAAVQRRREATERLHQLAMLGRKARRDKTVTGFAVLQLFADARGMSVRSILSRSRNVEAIRIRDAALRTVFDARPDLSLPLLGRIFGNRDHTTIRHSLRKTAKPGFDYRNNPLPVSRFPAPEEMEE